MYLIFKSGNLFSPLLLISILPIIFTGCEINQQNKVIKTDNETLNELLQGAPLQLINLDKIIPDSINIDTDNILGIDSYSDFPALPHLYGVNGMTMAGDYLYIGDQRHNEIWVMDKLGKWIRKKGGEGSGPGEFRGLTGVYSNSRYIYSMDIGNQRINVYNHQLLYKNSIDASIIWPFNDMSVDDSYLYLPEERSHEKMIEIREAVTPYRKKNSAIPRLIPQGMQPIVYNKYKITSGHHELIVFGYSSLPFVFIFDKNFNQLLTIVLESDIYHDFDNPSVKPVASLGNEIHSFSQYFEGLFLMEDGSLFIAKQPYLFSLKWNGNKFDFERSWRFTYQSPIDRYESPQNVFVHNVVADEDAMYISSMFTPYVFKVHLK